jgi:hypothetical protein
MILWQALAIAVFLLLVVWIAIAIECLGGCCDQIEHKDDLQ